VNDALAAMKEEFYEQVDNEIVKITRSNKSILLGDV